MEIASTVINVFVVIATGIVLNYLARDRISRLEARLDTGLSEVKQDIARLEDRMDDRFNAVRSEFNAVHSDLTAVALAVGAKTPTRSRESGHA